MREYNLLIDDRNIPVRELDTVVLGSGCAGYNAADWLYDLGERDIAIITEGRNMGTSRNTGSDKQTYYKLSLASDGADCVQEMAETLFKGGAVHGDTALIEAACSVKCFCKLANLGVPFPSNRYGEYVGYKTDHDPRQRATSAGPLTSKYMTECLERSIQAKNVAIHDNTQVIQILTDGERIQGALAIELDRAADQNCGLVLYRFKHIIVATGGPAAVYATSVFPESQTGNSGMLLATGAKGANLQSWQFGLASTRFRWNVSGTYQQVLPRYIAVDPDGREREFLNDYFSNPYKAVDMVFLKGYQWPFDVDKVDGSSIIDIIVHHESMVKGNRVYMDFTRNPSCIDQGGFGGLSDETKRYLENSHALFGTPIERLEKMNKPAILLYRAHNIDLTSEPLEVAICAQHCNGGIAVDENWQSRIQGLYVAGEAAGTFGVHRPGGSALNSTQVGSMRAAEHIAYDGFEDFAGGFEKAVSSATQGFFSTVRLLREAGQACLSVDMAFKESQRLMSLQAAHIYDGHAVRETKSKLYARLKAGAQGVRLGPGEELAQYYKYMDTLQTQLAVLSAMELSAAQYGSRGSSLVVAEEGIPVLKELAEYRYLPSREARENYVLTTSYGPNGYISELEPVRPIPQRDAWFENVWGEYMRRTDKKGRGHE